VHPPGSYGLHGHGVGHHHSKIEKDWYAKHPEELAKEEDVEHLPADIRPKANGQPTSDAATSAGGEEAPPLSGDALSEAKRAASDLAEREFLERGLQEVGGVVVELAKRFNMNRSHLQVLLKKHGIRAKEFRASARSEH